MVKREVNWRDSKSLGRHLKVARLKSPSAGLMGIDWLRSRGLSRKAIASLAGGAWLRHGYVVLPHSVTGCGKTWLACALAARLGFSVLYAQALSLLEDCTLPLATEALTNVWRNWPSLIYSSLMLRSTLLDEFGVAPIAAHKGNDLLELLNDRVGTR